MTTTQKLRLDREALFERLGYQPHPGQLEVHRSRASRRVLACGVRWGKSRAAAMEALAAALEPRDRAYGWVVAPTYDLADKVFREIAIITAEHLRHRILTLKEHERKLVIRNLGGGVTEIRGKSSDNPVSLLGEGLDFVVVDEAARMKPTIWQSHLSQRLIDKKGWALLISTPKGKGWFYNLYQRGQSADPQYQSWNWPSWTNPYLDAKAIKAECDRLPEAVFDQEYGGKFIEGAGAVFRNLDRVCTGHRQEPEPGHRYVAGVDFAKVADYTVLAIADKDSHPPQVLAWDRFNRIDWELQVERLKGSLVRYNNAVANCDTTGVGDPIYEALASRGCRVAPYPFTQRSKQALIQNLAIMIERREIILPRREVWPEAVDELEAFEYEVTDAGNVKMEAPSGQHDDTVIAIALCAWLMRKFGSTKSVEFLL